VKVVSQETEATTITTRAQRQAPEATIEQRVAQLLRPGLPTLPVVTEMPQIAAPGAAALVEFYESLAECTKPTDGTPQATPPREGPGQPPLPVYLAIEAAYMVDIESRDMFTRPEENPDFDWDHPYRVGPKGTWPPRWQREPTAKPFSLLTVRGYLNPDYALTWNERDVHQGDAKPGAFRSSRLPRWPRKGREKLAALGVWPWALWPNGALPRDWREQQRTWDALAEWAE
jgi:hypothetical protein